MAAANWTLLLLLAFVYSALASPAPSPVNDLASPAPSPVNGLASPAPSPVNALASPAPSPVNGLASPAPSPVNGPSSGQSIEFIHACCMATLYPDVCFDSLSNFVDTVQLDPVRLALAATNLTLIQLQSMLVHTKKLSKECPNRGEAAALHVCTELLDDAVDLTRQSAVEIGLLVSTEGENVRWHISNAQTWLSAVITNEDTCADGMEEVAAGPMKDDICKRVWLAIEFTSISLALINHLVS